MNLLYIDLFCGAGGVTTGISQVPGVHVVACVNHDADAIASHAANHPRTLHYTEDIRTLDTAPMVSRLETMRARYPWAKTVLWASCECTNFSRAKGGKPRDPDSRSLAEHLYRYIDALEPDYIQIENVTEFLEWGPLIEQDCQLMPDPDRKGDSFREWFSHIEGMGYKGGWRIFNSADFGAYTSRTRLFIQFAQTAYARSFEIAEDPVEDALRFAVNSMMSYGGGIHKPGFKRNGLLRTTPYPQTWREYPAVVRECAAELRNRNIEINNMDALQVMARYDTPDTLHYVDPPYVQSTRGNRVRYAHEYDQEDHERLLAFLQTLKGKVVLSGYDSDLYARHLTGWRKECKVSHDTQGGKKIECLWLNYNPQLTLF